MEICGYAATVLSRSKEDTRVSDDENILSGDEKETFIYDVSDNSFD